MSIDNKWSEEAVDKLQEMAESIDYAMLATDLGNTPFHAIPMSTKRVDDQGAIWFLSSKQSTHNQNIERDAKVQLIYSHPGNMEFLTVYGEAEVVTDRSTLKDLYGSSDDAWFEGVDDPDLTALCIRPLDAHYWDSKHNKLITFAKIGVAAVTGDQPDIGVEGDLNVR